MHFNQLFGASFLALYYFARVAVADCECGYNVNLINDNNEAVYSDLLESDFTSLRNIAVDTDWVVQEWTVDAEASRGQYGRKLTRENVVSKPRQREDDQNAGLDLFVRSLREGEREVGCSEIDSARDDLIYGSFRAGLKITDVPGTCGAFFWYFNDTQEIDMEFLSSRLKESSSPIHLVVHSPFSFDKGGDAQATPLYRVVDLPFRADDAFHEYRFDWTPNKVTFYVDGRFIADIALDGYIPSVPGKLMLSHWSNGNSLWSEGPPVVDTAMTVAYVKAYFNSSDPSRARDYVGRCTNPTAPNAVCKVPDQTVAPLVFAPPSDPARPYFFYQDPSKNKTVNQTVYGEYELGIKKKSDATFIAASQVHYSMALAFGLVMTVYWL